MTDLDQPRWQQQSAGPQWEGGSCEDHAALPRRDSRRKSAPKDDQQLAAQPLHNKATRRNSRPKTSDSNKPRHRYMRKPRPDPEAFHVSPEPSSVHNPLHHFTQSSGQPSLEHDYESPMKSLKEEKQKLLHSLQKDEPQSSKNNQQKTSESSADGSTASTSGSNSSSSSASDPSCPQSKGSKSGVASLSSRMDSDKELELYSRQIRIELRQAEMIELAEEAERAAASGQKSFTGRASTFGCDESEIEIALEGGIKPRVTSSSKRKVRRSLDFGTPLGRIGTPLGRRLSLAPVEPAKISVNALRDVAEVVPSFKDFHLHLRTHFLRRKVDKRTLIFEEEGKKKNASPCRLHSNTGDSQHTAMHLWNTLNFGSWNASNHATMGSDTGHSKNTGRNKIESGQVVSSNSSDSVDIGELLSGHTQTPLRGSRRKRRPQVEVPPGLDLLSKDTFELQTGKGKSSPLPTAKPQGRHFPNHSVEPDTVSQYPSTPKPSGISDIGEDGSQQPRLWPETQSTDAKFMHFQDGSPTSPIVVDDYGVVDDQRRGRLYQGPSPPPGLPLTPKGNFQRVFDDSFTTPKDERLRRLLATNSVDPVDIKGPDFVTPVRLRDIRDDNIFGQSAYATNLPVAPLVKRSSIVETPNSIQEDYEDFPYETGCDDVERRTLDAVSSQGHIIPGQTKRLLMRPDKISPMANQALLDIGARAVGELADEISVELATDLPVLGLVDDKSSLKENESPVAGTSDSSQHQLRQSISMPVLCDDDNMDEVTIHRGGSCDAQQSRSLEPAGRTDFVTVIPAFASRLRPDEQETMDKPFQSDDADDLRNEVSVEARRHGTSIVLDLEDIARLDSKQGSVAGDSKQADHQSKATADFRCECLISPASSLESDEGGFQTEVSNRGKHSSWNLMEHTSIAPSDSNHQSLQAAVAMLSGISSTADRPRRDVVCASSKENDDFMTNYLYCSKTAEAPPPAPEPICSGSAPCQDTKMPCGEVAVDSCVGNFLETALRFLPRKPSHQSNKLLSLDRGRPDELQSKTLSWYDMANEKFDGLLERLMGHEHRYDDHCRLSYQAPSLKEKKLPQHPHKTPPPTPPRTPSLHEHEEVYDEDLGTVVYVQSAASSLELNNSQSSHRSFHSERGGNQRRPGRPRHESRHRRGPAPKRLLRYSLSDTAQFNDGESDSLHNRYSM